MPALPVARGPAGVFALRLGDDASTDVTVLSGRVEGGSIYADVIAATDGDPVAKKHLGPTKYESFALPIGLVMSKQLFEWLGASWGTQPPEQDGAVLQLDHKLAVKRQAGFSGSLITESVFPALDAGSNDAAKLKIRVQPAAIEVGPGAGTVSLTKVKQKVWRSSNFRLDIDGLDCTHVSRIESFTVRREITIVSEGSGTIDLVPGRVEFPNLRITLGQAWANTWYDWHEQFVVEGHNGEGFEREGALRFLSANLNAELCRIELRHLGIVRIVPSEDSAQSQQMLVTAELYCEEMALVEPPPGGLP